MPVTVTNGVELSNLGALDDGQPPRELNAGAGAPLSQTITIIVDKNGVGVAFGSVGDVGRWLEFEMGA